MDTLFVEDDFCIEEEPTSGKETQSTAEAGDDAHLAAPDGYFDCNICLDYAAEPVVTLCGHLYCWPCIYQWLRQESSTPQRCPVCKAALSQATLVPLYGRGYDGKTAALGAVPRRPSVTMTAAATAADDRHDAHRRHLHRHPYDHRHDGNYTMSSSSMTTARVLHPTMLGGVAIAVLPWVLGERGMGTYYPTSYPVGGAAGDSPRLRRQEMQAKRSLHRISIFLLCCVVLCLLVF